MVSTQVTTWNAARLDPSLHVTAGSVESFGLVPKRAGVNVGPPCHPRLMTESRAIETILDSRVVARDILVHAKACRGYDDREATHAVLNALGVATAMIDELPPELLDCRDDGRVAELEDQFNRRGFVVEMVPGESPSVRHDLLSACVGLMARLVEAVDRGWLPPPVAMGAIEAIRGIVGDFEGPPSAR